MAGLDNYLATLKDNAGMAGGYRQGLRDRSALDTTLVDLEQKRAQTQRYTGETPSYLRRGEAGARTAELANVQPEADLSAGVPQAKAQENLMSAKQKAREAQQAWERLPQEHKTKMINAIKSKQMEMFDTIEQTLAQTSDVPGTIALIEQQYPDVTQDQGWNVAKQQVSNMTPQQAMNEIRKMKASMASSDAYGSPEMQGKMVFEDQQQAGRKEIANIQGQYGLQEANAKAASAGSKPTTEQFIVNQLKTLHPNETDQQIAQRYIDYKTVQQKLEAGIIPELDVQTTTTKGGSNSGGASGGGDIASSAKQAFGAYEPSKYDYRINPSTGKLQRKPK